MLVSRICTLKNAELVLSLPPITGIMVALPIEFGITGTPMTLFLILIPGYLLITIYLANRNQAVGHTFDSMDNQLVRWLLYAAGWLSLMMGLFLVMASILADRLIEEGEAIYPVSSASVVAGVLLTWASSLLIFRFVGLPAWREQLRGLIGGMRSYNPQSIVHITAVVFSVLVFTGVIVLFWADGGSAAAAESASDISVDGILLQNALFIVAAVLGVGLQIRRDWSTVIQRLGLRVPTAADIRWGVGFGLGLFLLLVVISLVLVALFGDLNEEAATRQVEALIAPPLPLMLLMLVLIAIGEEVFFRGALQPVFGNLPVSLFFAIMHTQTLFSPLILVLIVVSLGLGWLRDHHSTTAAIIAHFCYNLIQLLIQMAAGT